MFARNVWRWTFCHVRRRVRLVGRPAKRNWWHKSDATHISYQNNNNNIKNNISNSSISSSSSNSSCNSNDDTTTTTTAAVAIVTSTITNKGILVATLPDAWYHRINTMTGWSGVSTLRQAWSATSVSMRQYVHFFKADLSSRYICMLPGRYASNQLTLTALRLS